MARASLKPSADCVPGQVEQVRDPRLLGLPFVIKQKGIVATASYPARALGIKKLQSYAEAKRLVPDIVTIVGEVFPDSRLH
jgi:nucleotidyltransferase/DNA polymerase involved in DNA repair